MNKKQFFKSWKLWQKIAFISGVALFIILLLIFLAIWVIFPLVFMNSISVQRFFIFFNFQDPKNPEFNNPQKYGMTGVVNFYITTKDLIDGSLVSIGAWLLLQENQIQSTKIAGQDDKTASEIIRNTKSPIAIYLHGVGCNRIKPKETYEVLRKHFLVISLDHRGYGDSGPDKPPTELGIVGDTSQVFQWIRALTDNDIYVWGHSLGTALSTHSVKRLKEQSIVPSGLILESPFTTMREEIPATSLGKIFSWMPWFTATVLNPIEKNGFQFKTTTNILDVDCPIMVMHAQDDNVIPYTLGEKVYHVASTERKIPDQGNVTFHLFGRLGYGHVGITSDPNVPKYIDEFIGFCKDQHKRRG
ncbi:lysophosphatidylserine lipase ABHD12 isoform X2 [Diabrotica virgifera virgifera]|nr:lysophosphatidylserine lipase ABHD12 isoform X2 [Diabrotica virgifera virgifera]